MRGPNCTKFGENMDQSLSLNRFVFGFRYVAPFPHESDPGLSGVD